MTTSKQVAGFMAWVLVTYSAALLGGIASAKAGLFYGQLLLPPWAPPAWLFGPVWTVLYLLMATAAWSVWREKGFESARIALSLFLFQLVANALWTWLFFVWRLGGISFVEIILLAVLIVCTIILFWRVRALNGVLLLPYLVWVCFAAVLNFSLWRLNPLLLK